MHRNKLAILGLILVGIVIAVAAADIHARQTAESAPQISSEAYAPTDSSAQDSLKADRVNVERLRYIIQTKLGQPVDTTELDSQINTIISANADIHISVALKDLRTDSVHNYGVQESMTAASVTKVLTAVDFLKQVELGHRSLDMIMADGNTAQYDIEQMIVYSDNDAWHTLNDNLTYPQMQSYAESIGITSYKYSGNTIGTADVTKLFGDMYQRKLINDSHTQLLLGYMERANYRDLIIPAVPEFDTVYHKAGWLTRYLNDATIITNGNETIVLTIFTDSVSSYDKARIASIMQQIATATLETFHLSTPPAEMPSTQ